MEITNTEVWGFEHAIRGARNPLESWDRSDSKVTNFEHRWVANTGCNRSCYGCINQHTCGIGTFKLGDKDLSLMQRLILAGTDHRKFMRQIMVSVDITAPLYWWKEEETYKVGTTANSTSTMHKLATTPITINCFEHDEDIEMEDYMLTTHMMFNSIINHCEKLRQKYLQTNDKRFWRALIQLLPESWLQTRTVTMNYENLRNMYFARRNHKLQEWHTFCDWIETLPYGKELICIEKEKSNADTKG